MSQIVSELSLQVGRLSDLTLPDVPTEAQSQEIIDVPGVMSNTHRFLQSTVLTERYSGPYSLHSDRKENPLYFSGGLGAPTALNWRKLAVELNATYDVRCSCATMDGFDGTWEAPGQVHIDDWIDGQQREVDLLGERPIALLHSASGFPGLIRELRNPGTHKALVIVAPPIDLVIKRHRYLLFLGEMLDIMTDQGFSEATRDLWPELSVPYAPRYTPEDRNGKHTAFELLCAAYTKLPFSTMAQFGRLITRGRQSISRLGMRPSSTPILFVFGDNDSRIDFEKSIAFVQKFMPRAEILPLERGTHSPQSGKVYDRFRDGVTEFLERTCGLAKVPT